MFYVEKNDKVVLDTPMLCVGEYVLLTLRSLIPGRAQKVGTVLRENIQFKI